MSAEMPVTKRLMVIESGSTSNAADTCREPTLIQSKRLTVTSRLLSCKSSTKATRVLAKLSATAPLWPSLMWRPFKRTIRNPARGSRMISVATCAISALHLGELVDRGRRAAPEDRHHDAEPDRHLGGGDDHDEEHNRLTADVAQGPRKGHEREVHGVEHQLEAHEHDQGASAREQTKGPDPEEQRGEHEVPGGGDVHDETSSLEAPRSRRASSTAPTTAITSSAAVASKAKRYVVNTAVPSSFTLPWPVEIAV